jgi:hypothetical protein
MPPARVLIFGSTGYFGRLLIDDLARYSECRLVLASRRPVRPDRFETVVADLTDYESLKTALSGVDVLICAAGPFQGLPTLLPEICIDRSIHYIDFADDRSFVQKVRSIAESRNPGSAICTGWSTVSALSGALVRIAASGMQHIDSIYIHMAPGNRGARQAGTIASLLHSVGKPFSVCRAGSWQTIIGWSEPRDFNFPAPVGVRTGYVIDVADHQLFPGLFSAVTVEFRTGSELGFLNYLLCGIAKTRRNYVPWTLALKKAASLLSWMGHDWGALGVEVHGSRRRRACITADRDGPRIAVLPASVTANLLASGGNYRGIISPADWITREELDKQCRMRGLRLSIEEI